MIKISFLGDALCEGMAEKLRRLYYSETEKRFNFSAVFAPLSQLLHESDFVSVNLETPVTRDESELNYRRWEFCAPIEFVEALKETGVHYASTANNHCLDRGVKGLETTIRCLDELGIEHSGTQLTEKSPLPIVTVGTLKLGMLSYTYGTNAFSNHQYLGIRDRKKVCLLQEQEEAIETFIMHSRCFRYLPRRHIRRVYYRLDRFWHPENKGKPKHEKTTFNLYRRALLKKDIKRLRKNGVDLIAINLHIGGQYNAEPNKFTKDVVQWLLKHNVNLVIGNHEHVVLSTVNHIEKQQFATYAIGNLLGGAGTIHPPFDRFAEYSIAVHFMIDDQTKRIEKITFSILKTVLKDSGRFEVWPLFDLIQQASGEEKEKLIADGLAVAKIFSGKAPEKITKEISF